MTDFELWLKGAEINNDPPYCLEGKDDSGIYMQKKPYMCQYRICYEPPVYHVFNKGKEMLTTGNLQYAYNEWRKYV